jgi:hypothetical protein
MIERTNPAVPPARDPPGDWLDALLARDADRHAGNYLSDAGFTARVMQMLPLAGALPAWRRPALAALWVIAAIGLALALPGTAVDVAREAFRLFAARPFSLSTVALVIAAMGCATWAGAAVALRRD